MDWQSLTEKLRGMGMQKGLGDSVPQSAPRRRPIEDVVSGRYLSTIYGPVFSAETRLPKEHLHGHSRLTPAFGWKKLANYSRHPHQANADLENFIFLDTETTGLSGGTGTMAFMVGVARFEQDHLHLEQFFIRNPSEETAMLTALERFCHGMEAVVTYNGKAFDIPILNTRYILQSLISPFEDLPHFDLLALTRRLWKARLEHCNLGVIEKEIMGSARSQADIPGYLVPEYYRDYLRTGDPEPIKGIFYHNREDVVSLAALFAILADLLENPTSISNDSIKDHISLGAVMERLGEADQASALYQRGASISSEMSEEKGKALLLQGNLQQKTGNMEGAQSCWEQAAALGSTSAMIKLAKYYEHNLKDYEKALEYALKASKAALRGLPSGKNSSLDLADSKKRLARLAAKINGQS